MRSNTRAGAVLKFLLMVILAALSVLPAATQVSDNASIQSSDQLTRPFSKAATATLADIRRWKEKALVEAQSGMLNATYGATLRTRAYEDFRRAQSATETQGDKQASDLLRQHLATVEAWVDQLIQARQNMSMDPAGLGQDPELMNIDECERALDTMLGNGTYTGIDACQ